YCRKRGWGVPSATLHSLFRQVRVCRFGTWPVARAYVRESIGCPAVKFNINIHGGAHLNAQFHFANAKYVFLPRLTDDEETGAIPLNQTTNFPGSCRILQVPLIICANQRRWDLL